MGLDSYYLQQERLYRSLYEKVRIMGEKDIDFSLMVTKNEFMNDKNGYFRVLLSKTEIWFYLPLEIVCAGIIIITHV